MSWIGKTSEKNTPCSVLHYFPQDITDFLTNVGLDGMYYFVVISTGHILRKVKHGTVFSNLHACP